MNLSTPIVKCRNVEVTWARWLIVENVSVVVVCESMLCSVTVDSKSAVLTHCVCMLWACDGRLEYCVDYICSVLWCCCSCGSRGVRRVERLECWVGCWHHYLSGVTCRLGYGLSSWCHCHSLSLSSVNPDWFVFLPHVDTSPNELAIKWVLSSLCFALITYSSSVLVAAASNVAVWIFFGKFSKFCQQLVSGVNVIVANALLWIN